jgi:hypothetical protein
MVRDQESAIRYDRTDGVIDSLSDVAACSRPGAGAVQRSVDSVCVGVGVLRSHVRDEHVTPTAWRYTATGTGAMDLKELESGVDPKTHWYYQSKTIPLVAFIRKVFAETKQPLTMIDVGSGSGFFMYELDEMIPSLIAHIYLVDIGYSDEDIASSGTPKIEKTRSLPTTIENAVVVMMDVLEHVENDTALLNEIKKRAVGENHFFITVPAFMTLWSGHDVYLGHYRRYTKATMKKLLQESSFQQSSTYYIYGSIFPAVWLARRLKDSKTKSRQSDMKPIGNKVNALLKIICSFEMHFLKMNAIAGVTCVSEGSV